LCLIDIGWGLTDMGFELVWVLKKLEQKLIRVDPIKNPGLPDRSEIKKKRLKNPLTCFSLFLLKRGYFDFFSFFNLGQLKLTILPYDLDLASG